MKKLFILSDECIARSVKQQLRGDFEVVDQTDINYYKTHSFPEGHDVYIIHFSQTQFYRLEELTLGEGKKPERYILSGSPEEDCEQMFGKIAKNRLIRRAFYQGIPVGLTNVYNNVSDIVRWLKENSGDETK